MTRGDRVRLASAVAFALALGIAAAASAEEDQLIGVKVKDGTPPASSTHAFSSSAPGWAGNCTLKKPQFYLMRGEQDGGDDPNGGPAQEYVCYKAVCEAPPPDFAGVADARGTHDLDGKKVKLVCLPSGSTCGNGSIDPGEACDGLAVGACLAGCDPDCTCAPPPPCPGAVIAGSCWVLALPGEDCNATCADALRPYDTATETYAGSGGTLLNCTTVLTAIAGVVPASGSCPDGLGCAAGISFLFPDRHCVTPATTAAASNLNYQRACACVE